MNQSTEKIVNILWVATSDFFHKTFQGCYLSNVLEIYAGTHTRNGNAPADSHMVILSIYFLCVETKLTCINYVKVGVPKFDNYQSSTLVGRLLCTLFHWQRLIQATSGWKLCLSKEIRDLQLHVLVFVFPCRSHRPTKVLGREIVRKNGQLRYISFTQFSHHRKW